MQVSGTRKLALRFVGPFPVVQRVGPVAYRLEIPKRWKVHDVFHVSLLKPYHEGGGDGVAVPAPVEIDGQEEWEVERILRTKGRG